MFSIYAFLDSDGNIINKKNINISDNILEKQICDEIKYVGDSIIICSGDNCNGTHTCGGTHTSDNTHIFNHHKNNIKTIVEKNLIDTIKYVQNKYPEKNAVIIGDANLYSQAIHHPLCNKIYIYMSVEYIPPSLNEQFPLSKINKLYDRCIKMASNYFDNKTNDYKMFDNFRLSPNILNYNKLSYDNRHPQEYLICEINKINIDEQKYLSLVEKVANMPAHPNRSAVNTRSVFGEMLRFNLKYNVLPLYTTKHMPFKTILRELFWFLRGSADIAELKQHNIHIWDLHSSREHLDANNLTEYPEGVVGPIYGWQWRHYNKEFDIKNYKNDNTNLHKEKNNDIDQIKDLITSLINDPYSRRHIVLAWNPCQLKQMSLPPCHVMTIWNVVDDKSKKILNCMLVMRSNDLFLGNPFNVAQYSMLVHIIAHICGYTAGELIVSIADAHIYETHITNIKTQISRTPFNFPLFNILRKRSQYIEDYLNIDDYELLYYTHHEKITGQIC